jgi:hypothetical protein
VKITVTRLAGTWHKGLSDSNTGGGNLDTKTPDEKTPEEAPEQNFEPPTLTDSPTTHGKMEQEGPWKRGVDGSLLNYPHLKVMRQFICGVDQLTKISHFGTMNTARIGDVYATV